MNQKLRNLATGFAATCLAVYAFSGISMGSAATGVGGTDSFGTNASASADTLAACAWYVSGVDPSVSLTNTSGMEYVGDDYELTGSNSSDISIFFSGSDSADTRCSFYDDEKGVAVNVSWTGTTFAKGGGDASLDFQAGDALENPANNVDGQSSFNITYTAGAGSCTGGWTSGATERITGVATPPLTPASIADVDVATNFSPTLTGGSATFASCNLNASYATWLPGGKTPSNPGSSYSFTGPTLTTTVVINE